MNEPHLKKGEGISLKGWTMIKEVDTNLSTKMLDFLKE